MRATNECTEARYPPIDCLLDRFYGMAPRGLSHSDRYKSLRSAERPLVLHKLRLVSGPARREQDPEDEAGRVVVSHSRVPTTKVGLGRVRRTPGHSNDLTPDSFSSSLFQREPCPPRIPLVQAPLSSAPGVRSCALSKQKQNHLCWL